MSKNTGGAAFPSPGVVLHGNQQGAYEGATMRDYFAAKAPAVPNDFGWQGGEVNCAQRIVRWNYFYADLMIAERAK